MNAACVRGAVHLGMREAVAAWPKGAGLSRAARWSPQESKVRRHRQVRAKQWKGQSKSTEEKDSEKMGRVGKVVGVRDGRESSARERAGLGGDECSSGWW